MPTGDGVPTPGKHYMSFLLAILHPYSRGSVHITSSDALALPELDLHLYEHEIDLDLLVEGIKFGRRLLETDAMKAAVKAEVIPGPEVKTDEEIKEFVRLRGQTVYHPIATASMLPREDGGVVDADLKVYGTKNVRVVDASIIPVHISAHPHSTIYAVAERVSTVYLDLDELLLTIPLGCRYH